MAQPRHSLLRHFGRGHTAEYRGSTTPLSVSRAFSALRCLRSKMQGHRLFAHPRFGGD